MRIYYSRRDTYGNCYWAFTFTDVNTGKTISATISGGESNINAVRFGWRERNEWYTGISTHTVGLPIREFNRMVKEWPYAGCTSEDIRKYIKRHLGE